jgi:hypothetical protein
MFLPFSCIPGTPCVSKAIDPNLGIEPVVFGPHGEQFHDRTLRTTREYSGSPCLLFSLLAIEH